MLCKNNEGWIVGGARFLADIENNPPKDWDVIVPAHQWTNCVKSVPMIGTRLNSFGGFKWKTKHLNDTHEIDLWCDDIGSYFTNIRQYPNNLIAANSET